jgi:hypothetical protein
MFVCVQWSCVIISTGTFCNVSLVLLYLSWAILLTLAEAFFIFAGAAGQNLGSGYGSRKRNAAVMSEDLTTSLVGNGGMCY